MLANHVLELCDWVQQGLRPQYYEILNLVLNRGELSLGQLKITEEGSSKDFLQKKIELGVAYQLFIYKVLEKCIKKLNMKGVETYKRQFIETGISTSFFHLPAVKSEFVGLLSKKEEMAGTN